MIAWVLRNKGTLIAALVVIYHPISAIYYHMNRERYHEFLKANASEFAFLADYIDTPLFRSLEVAIMWSPTVIIAYVTLVMGTYWYFCERNSAGE